MIANTIQINTAKDRFNFVLHSGANLALLAGVVYADKSIIDLTLMTVAYSSPFVLKFLHNHIGDRNNIFATWLDAPLLPPTTAKSFMMEDAARLQRVSDSLSKRLGVDSIEVRIMGSLANDKDENPKIKSRKNTISEFNDGNAMLLENMIAGKKVCGFSEKYVRILDHPEQEAILAHEYGHDAAKHNALGFAANFAGGVAFYLSFLHAADALTGGQGSGFWAGYMICATWAAKNFLQNSYSRVCEFQADRIEARITSPQIAISALTKMSEPEELKPEGLFGKIDLLFYGSHPNSYERIRQLQKMILPSP